MEKNSKFIILLGAPGSGKGTQGKILAEIIGYKTVSTGDLLRNEISSGTQIGKKAEEIVKSGKLVTDQIVLEILESYLTSTSSKGFILDGFPRTLNQAVMLENLLEKLESSVAYAINFEVNQEDLVKRLSSRFSCSNCKEGYNKLFKMPLKEGICDKCGSKEFTTRADDKPEVIRERFNEYNKLTAPLIPFYKNSGVFFNIDANRNIDEIRSELVSLVKNY